MSTINATEIKKGMTIKFNNELYEVTDYDHITPGNWRAMIQAKMRNLKTNSTLEYRFRSSDRIEVMLIEMTPSEYLYQKGSSYIFMNTQNYEEISISQELLKEKTKYLSANQSIMLVYCDGNLIDVQLPITVDLKITETSPPLKTATITNVSKSATLETGLVVQVPAFIEQGEVVRVDTRDGRYMERVRPVRD
ncbi:MAG: elongation factor P [Planctomycetota bacterium]|nr:elongation factor P [Planctomycetota bacterium]